MSLSCCVALGTAAIYCFRVPGSSHSSAASSPAPARGIRFTSRRLLTSRSAAHPSRRPSHATETPPNTSLQRTRRQSLRSFLLAAELDIVRRAERAAWNARSSASNGSRMPSSLSPLHAALGRSSSNALASSRPFGAARAGLRISRRGLARVDAALASSSCVAEPFIRRSVGHRIGPRRVMRALRRRSQQSARAVLVAASRPAVRLMAPQLAALVGRHLRRSRRRTPRLPRARSSTTVAYSRRRPSRSCRLSAARVERGRLTPHCSGLIVSRSRSFLFAAELDIVRRRK